MSGGSDRERQVDDVIQWLTNITRRDNCTLSEAARRFSFVDDDILRDAINKIDEIAKGIIVGPRDGVLLLQGEERPQPWYIGPQVDDVYWPSLRQHLEQANWDQSALRALDVSSTKVLANISNPALPEASTRGLVLGYIQSGKTTNFTAVISKAADAGYRMFIVLSGVSNSLRRQTQVRLTEQLVSLKPLNWDSLTDEFRDMGTPRRFGFAGLAQPGVRTLAVVKKNPTRLRNLISFLEAANRAGALENCPILVIDDEADQASLSPHLNVEKRTAINDLIVKLLTSFPKVSYVAYTATPFANFFVDPSYPENLYPRDFIVSLPEPEGYFGPRRMYGISDEDPPEIDVVRLVPDDEVSKMVPPKGSANKFRPTVTASLLAALRWFFLASTARRLMSNGIQPHSTMMIHTSERVAQHRHLWEVVASELERIRLAVRRNDPSEIEAFRQLWSEEAKAIDPAKFGHVLPTVTDILGGLLATLDEIGDLSSPEQETCGLIIDNGQASRRLLYDNSMPKPVIVIGGNTLARGLTLEGLVSSIFVRSVGLYDTLLQMGRWFGYRRGYESLPRVWMPLLVASRFAHLSRVEQEIREEIERYADSNITPLEVAVKIRTHPAMSITRAQMMKAVRHVRVGYSGSEVDTAYIFNDASWLRRNRQAAESLAAKCVELGIRDEETPEIHKLFRNVSYLAVTEFFGSESGYRVQPAAGSRFTEDGVLHYIRSRIELGELRHWNVVFVGAGGGRETLLCDGLVVRTVQRGRDEQRTKGQIISIGDHLPGLSHKGLDLPANPNPGQPPKIWRDRQDPRTPLLMVYVVDKDSKASSRGDRKDLNIVDDFIGIGICFPTSFHETDDSFVEVVLPPQIQDGADEEFEDDMDEQELDAEGSADDIQSVEGR